jgi:hypothetical protein
MKKQTIVGAAVLGLLSFGIGANADAGGSPPAAEPAKGECHGMNSCKGTGACGGKGHSCAGLNECKGQGWLKMTKKACEEKKGTFKAK